MTFPCVHVFYRSKQQLKSFLHSAWFKWYIATFVELIYRDYSAPSPQMETAMVKWNFYSLSKLKFCCMWNVFVQVRVVLTELHFQLWLSYWSCYPLDSCVSKSSSDTSWENTGTRSTIGLNWLLGSEFFYSLSSLCLGLATTVGALHRGSGRSEPWPCSWPTSMQFSC